MPALPQFWHDVLLPLRGAKSQRVKTIHHRTPEAREERRPSGDDLQKGA